MAIKSKSLLFGALFSLLSFNSFAADDEFIFTYDYEGAEHDLFGIQRNVQIDAALLLKNSAYTGCEVLGISVDIPSKTGCACDPSASAWLTRTLQVDGEYNLPDLMEKTGEIINYGTESEPQLRLDIDFDQPYTLTEDGIYVGYTVTVLSCNVPGSGWTIKYPLVTVCDVDAPESLMIHCTKGTSTLPQKYPEWTDIGISSHQALAMRIKLRGAKFDHSATLEPIQTLYSEPGETGYVYTNLTNNGNADINSIKYSYSIEENGNSTTHYNELTLDSPVEANRSAVLDLPFIAPEQTGSYEIPLILECINGEENSHKETFSLKMEVVPYLPVHNPLVEDYSGLWCGYCPEVYVMTKTLNEKYGEEFIAVAYHVSDALQSLETHYMPAASIALPALYIENREEEVIIADTETIWQRTKRELAPAGIDVNIYWTDKNKTELRAESTVKFIDDYDNADFRIAYALVEDGMSDPKWLQANHFTNEKREGKNWELFCGKAPYVTNLVYDDVVVSCPEPLGIANSIPEQIKEGKEYSQHGILKLADAVNTYTTGTNYKKNLIKDPDKLRIVAMLIDHKTGKVCNCATTGYSGDAEIYSVITGLRDINDDTSAGTVLTEEYYALSGVRLRTAPENGAYIKVQTMSDGSTRSQKIVK